MHLTPSEKYSTCCSSNHVCQGPRVSSTQQFSCRSPLRTACRFFTIILAILGQKIGKFLPRIYSILEALGSPYNTVKSRKKLKKSVGSMAQNRQEKWQKINEQAFVVMQGDLNWLNGLSWWLCGDAGWSKLVEWVIMVIVWWCRVILTGWMGYPSDCVVLRGDLDWLNKLSGRLFGNSGWFKLVEWVIIVIVW